MNKKFFYANFMVGTTRKIHTPNIVNPARLSKAGVIRLGVRGADGRGVEAGHFIFDIGDEKIRLRAMSVYGEKPTSLNITFFSDNIEDVFYCGLQRWGSSSSGTPYLVCEGDGKTAVSNGKSRPCPCASFGRECRKTTLLKFLIPDITIGGYFRMVTKSDHSAGDLETPIRIVHRATKGLIMRPFRLKRTEGYAKISGVKTKKFYVALECHGALPPVPVSDMPKIPDDVATSIIPSVGQCFPIPIVIEENDFTSAYAKDKRLDRGRKRVKDKIKQSITNPFTETALEKYACSRFQKNSFRELDIEELLLLFHDIEDNPGIVNQIYEVSLEYMAE